MYVNGEASELDAAVAHLLGEVPVIRKSVTTLADDYAMPASTAKTLLAVTFPCGTQGDLEKMVDRLNVLDLELAYSSAYREKLPYDSRALPRARLAARPSAPTALPKGARAAGRL